MDPALDVRYGKRISGRDLLQLAERHCIKISKSGKQWMSRNLVTVGDGEMEVKNPTTNMEAIGVYHDLQKALLSRPCSLTP